MGQIRLVFKHRDRVSKNMSLVHAPKQFPISSVLALKIILQLLQPFVQMEWPYLQLLFSRGLLSRSNGGRIILWMLHMSFFFFSSICTLINKVIFIRLGYQKKGWTDGEISIEWIKIFDKKTHAKANGKYWLLVVDGHNSYYTSKFLRYAHKNQIIVICYPTHATHLYQGLDVIVFSVLKTYLSDEQDKQFWETGLPINKNNFLHILWKAWICALTPDIIKTAFQKTAIHPFDPSVIQSHQLALSKETSCKAYLPVALPHSNVTSIITDMLHKLQLAPDIDANGSSEPSGDSGALSHSETFINHEVMEEMPVARPSWPQITRSATQSTKPSNLPPAHTPSKLPPSQPTSTSTDPPLQEKHICFY